VTARHHYPLPFGAELVDGARTRFRMWAPDLQELALVIEGLSPIPVHRGKYGMFECEVYCGAGTRYQYRIGNNQLVPDPASRLQDFDVNDASVVCDPRDFFWHHDEWRGRSWHEMVIYEMHVGCLGGFERATKLLPELAELGITAVELMPIADFSGRRNWGYDGVLPFAPDRSYGSPQQLKQFIDTAHGLGLCVYLDVVYNHFGPDGNYLHSYASTFFDAHRQSPWGAAIDFMAPRVRQFFTSNALYWLLEYRFDGLRFDAVHQISDPGWLDEVATQIRAAVEPGRHVHLMLENEHNVAAHLDGLFDAQWNDDGHNVLHVLLTGETDSYYENYRDMPAKKLARCLSEGFVFQGDIFARSESAATAPAGVAYDYRPRGTPSAHLPPHAFVLFLQNHDQIGNRAFGERLTTLIDEDKLRAAVVLQLLAPQIPLLFMGEEWGSRTPFLFFTDFHDELARAVRDGRRREFAALPAFADAATREQIPDPNAPLTFTMSIPDRSEKKSEPHQRYLALYRELLALRQRHVVPGLARCRSLGADVLSEAAVMAAWQLGDGATLTIATNFGVDPVPLQQQPAALGQLLCDSRISDRHAPRSRDATAATDQYLPPHTTRVYLRGAAA
jgi:malto-oligosyltrehalose trehalohydrolase